MSSRKTPSSFNKFKNMAAIDESVPNYSCDLSIHFKHDTDTVFTLNVRLSACEQRPVTRVGRPREHSNRTANRWRKKCSWRRWKLSVIRDSLTHFYQISVKQYNLFAMETAKRKKWQEKTRTCFAGFKILHFREFTRGQDVAESTTEEEILQNLSGEKRMHVQRSCLWYQGTFRVFS